MKRYIPIPSDYVVLGAPNTGYMLENEKGPYYSIKEVKDLLRECLYCICHFDEVDKSDLLMKRLMAILDEST